MIIDPKATTVLCFGDSNTNGASPDKSGRYPSDVRWTGQLQRILGDSYYVIEEGLGGRTTDSDHFREGKPGRNGFTYYKPALETHLPLDFIIIMLGTNDVKNTYNKTPEEIANSLAEYVEYTRKVVNEKGLKQPKIILVSPTPIDERSIQDVYDETSVQKSLELAVKINSIAEKLDCAFIDAGKHAKVGEDGIHLTRESNEPLAQAIAGAIQS
jgi:lysophospholipase L1-like esterase